MSFDCPRCGKRVDRLVPLDSIKYNYQGTLTRACADCANSMMTMGEFAPSGSAERMARAQKVADKTRRELAAVRRKWWLVRIVWVVVIASAGWWLWSRFPR